MGCEDILDVKLSIFPVGAGLYQDSHVSLILFFGAVRDSKLGASGLSFCQDAGTLRPDLVSLGALVSCLLVIRDGAGDGHKAMVKPVRLY